MIMFDQYQEKKFSELLKKHRIETRLTALNIEPVMTHYECAAFIAELKLFIYECMEDAQIEGKEDYSEY